MSRLLVLLALLCYCYAAQYSLFSGLSDYSAGYGEFESNGLPHGLRFKVTQSGCSLVAIKYYNAGTNTYQVEGQVYQESTLNQLRICTFAAPSGTWDLGWKQCNLPSALSLTANQIYVLGVQDHAWIANIHNGFTNAASNGPLYAPANSDGTGNGVSAMYIDQMPTQKANYNYMVDVIVSC